VELRLLSQESTGVLELATEGRITQDAMSNSPDPVAHVAGEEAYAKKILLNLQNSDYMDSSGVSWLLKMDKRSREAGGKLILHSVPPMISQILRVLRMELVLTIASDAESARKLVEGDPAP
jgi:anti-anti-sigma factor